MVESNQNQLAHGERRDADRVQDAVGLQVQRLHELPAAGEVAAKSTPVGRVRRANKYDINGYADVKRDYPAVALYVEELEERIRQLLLDGASSSESPTHKVSLSASGMAFADDSLMYPGEQIGLTITLFPSLRRVACDARVVSAGDAPEIANGEKHTYRLNFVRMTDADKQALDLHVQMLRIRHICTDVRSERLFCATIYSSIGHNCSH